MNNSKPKVVCLCGSTRFYKEFQEANFQETMKGKIVLTVGFYPHSQTEAHGQDVDITPEDKEMLDELHLRKIDLADEILVLNVGGYIGKSTWKEISYAFATGKGVRWLESDEVDPDDLRVFGFDGEWIQALTIESAIKQFHEFVGDCEPDANDPDNWEEMPLDKVVTFHCVDESPDKFDDDSVPEGCDLTGPGKYETWRYQDVYKELKLLELMGEDKRLTEFGRWWFENEGWMVSPYPNEPRALSNE